MKIGILQCDSVLDEYQSTFGDYPQMFISLFQKIDLNLTFTTYDLRKGALPLSVDECDAYITTGSRLSVYDDIPWLPQLQHFISEISQSNIKLVGICFVHQLIADLFSGKTEKSTKGWGVGVAKNKIASQKKWMNPYQRDLKIVVSHQDQVINLPPKAELIGTSGFCPNFMFLLGENILTIQGHPEFSTDYSKALMTHRRERIGEQCYLKALTTLSSPTDDLVLARWILNFMK